MADVILLDGGTGQELVHRSQDEAHPLWSAKVMLDHPELVEVVHLDYIEAGATVITVNAYSATPERLARHGLEGEFDRLQARAVALARRARDRAGREVRIAGCLPPLVGSYHPEAAPPFEACVERYRAIVAAQAPGVDLFVCETMGSSREARAAVTAALESGLETWCSYTLQDTANACLRSGEALGDVVHQMSDLDHHATLLNCSRPEAMGPALAVLAGQVSHFGAYANGGPGVA